MKLPITLRAAIARYNRHLVKNEEIFKKFRTPIESDHYFAIVSIGYNIVTWSGNYSSLIEVMREAGALKPYEEVVG